MWPQKDDDDDDAGGGDDDNFDDGVDDVHSYQLLTIFDSPVKHVVFSSFVKPEPQRGEVTCLGSHS